MEHSSKGQERDPVQAAGLDLRVDGKGSYLRDESRTGDPNSALAMAMYT